MRYTANAGQFATSHCKPHAVLISLLVAAYINVRTFNLFTFNLSKFCCQFHKFTDDSICIICDRYTLKEKTSFCTVLHNIPKILDKITRLYKPGKL